MMLKCSLEKRTNEPISPPSDRFLGKGLIGCWMELD